MQATFWCAVFCCAKHSHPAVATGTGWTKLTSAAVPRFVARWRVKTRPLHTTLVPNTALRKERWKMRFSLLLVATIIGACVLCHASARADGLLYQLPEDGSWVRFEGKYTFKIEGMEQAGQGTGRMTMASVGKAREADEACRWIEFKVQTKDMGPEHTLIRKLLIPEKRLKKGENGTEHVVRGWAKYDDEDVERAVPVHGRWPAYLAGPLQDEKKLDTQLVESKLGDLMCEGVAGWIQYKEGDVHMKVTFGTRLHEKAPFGVVSSRMQFEMKRDDKIQQIVDGNAEAHRFRQGC
jgi:hypothetical protein